MRPLHRLACCTLPPACLTACLLAASNSKRESTPPQAMSTPQVGQGNCWRISVSREGLWPVPLPILPGGGSAWLHRMHLPAS